MTLKYEQTKILKIDVEKMFLDYYKNAQKDFENEVYLKLKKRTNISKAQLDKYLPKSTFIKMLYSQDDSIVDIVFEKGSDFWSKKTESEIIEKIN